MPDLPDAPFRKARLTWTVENQGGASAEIDLREDQITDAWTPGANSIHITGDRDWAGDLTRIERTGGPGEDFVGWKASALGLYHRLDYRIVRHDIAVNDEVAVIVDALLSEAQDNQFNGDMGFSMGDVVGTTVSRRRGYCVGINIGDAIRELASIGRGFDWEVDANRRLNIWNNTRGIDTGFVLTEEQCQGFDINLDTEGLLTNVTAIADPSDPYGPKFRMSHMLSGTGHFYAFEYGRREVSIDTDIIALNEENPGWEDELYDAGNALLKVQGGGILHLTAMWTSDRAPWGLHDVWLQDSVSVVLPEIFGGTIDMRCTDVTVTIEAMPFRDAGALPPIYWVEYGFDAVVRDLDIEDGDPDQAS